MIYIFVKYIYIYIFIYINLAKRLVLQTRNYRNTRVKRTKAVKQGIRELSLSEPPIFKSTDIVLKSQAHR